MPPYMKPSSSVSTITTNVAEQAPSSTPTSPGSPSTILKTSRKRNLEVHTNKNNFSIEIMEPEQQQHRHHHDHDHDHDDACGATTSSSSTSSSTISFGEVSIREYPIILGVNPSCSLGAPVCLDWQYEELSPLSVDEFEASKTDEVPRAGSGQRRKRSKPKQFYLSCYKRKDILGAAGYDQDDLEATERTVKKDRLKRNISVYQSYPLIIGRKLRTTCTRLKTKAFVVQYRRRSEREQRKNSRKHLATAN
eukprot:CAMPEP_0113477308 /NCGR_PEP_ID=MMETSP0014_2-20120614/20138_1 /TAXON_ID=2857 /ORGANISM="Nitzschia sp." /LENGTH=249 /DNA_ID=CAMNT_0000370393 /DNA_START=248 /DNA_END=997 /DNA_ORIENTATION=+ /assembly_acc=CAM_ASM_000159